MQNDWMTDNHNINLVLSFYVCMLSKMIPISMSDVNFFISMVIICVEMDFLIQIFGLNVWCISVTFIKTKTAFLHLYFDVVEIFYKLRLGQLNIHVFVPVFGIIYQCM